MKTTTTSKLAVAAALTVGLGLLAGSTMTLNAADSGPVKGATVLMRLNALNIAIADLTPVVNPMSCAHCTDIAVTVRDTDTRGAGAKTLVAGGAPTRTITKHGCVACGNEWVVKGHGKAGGLESGIARSHIDLRPMVARPGEEIRQARRGVLFPLTLTLSLGEREQ